MTRHLRNSHRNHRKTTWGLVAVLVVAIAAVVIPIASGAGDKSYTITVSPSSVCSSPTDGGASTVLTLKNTSSPQSFGSAEVYFPPNTVFEVTVSGDPRLEHEQARPRAARRTSSRSGSQSAPEGRPSRSR